MVPDAVNLATVQRILVVKLRHHGDVLLASPVFSVLKARAPHAEIDALVYADTRDMLAGHPSIAAIHGIDRAWKRQDLLTQARREVDVVLAESGSGGGAVRVPRRRPYVEPAHVVG